MKHPYPEHIAETVGAQFAGLLGYVFNDLPDHDQDLFRRNADMILTALWDASRVDTLDQLAQLPGDAVIRGQDYWLGYTPDAQFQLSNDDLPAHVLHWGDTDE